MQGDVTKYMDNDFISFLDKCGHEFDELSLRGMPEEVSARDAYKAYFIIKAVSPKDEPQAFLFCAAMNLLNRYVKQTHRISYAFKRHMRKLVNFIARKSPANISVDLQKDKGMALLVISFSGIQFSFHNVDANITSFMERSPNIAMENLDWDGVRKQKIAVSVFERGLMALDYSSGPYRDEMAGLISLAMRKYDEGITGLSRRGPSTPEAEMERHEENMRRDKEKRAMRRKKEQEKAARRHKFGPKSIFNQLPDEEREKLARRFKL